MITYDVCYTGYRSVVEAVSPTHAITKVRDSATPINLAAAVVRRRSICPDCKYGYVCVSHDGTVDKER